MRVSLKAWRAQALAQSASPLPKEGEDTAGVTVESGTDVRRSHQCRAMEASK